MNKCFYDFRVYVVRMSDDVPSLADLQKQRVVDLKKELARLGLPQGGVKADLVARLNEYYQVQDGQLYMAVCFWYPASVYG